MRREALIWAINRAEELADASCRLPGDVRLLFEHARQAAAGERSAEEVLVAIEQTTGPKRAESEDGQPLNCLDVAWTGLAQMFPGGCRSSCAAPSGHLAAMARTTALRLAEARIHGSSALTQHEVNKALISKRSDIFRNADAAARAELELCAQMGLEV